MPILQAALIFFFLVFLLPLGVSAARYRFDGTGAGWRAADRSSAGLLPAARDPGAAVGVFAVHCWVVFKPEGAAAYTRYDYTAWGEPIRTNGFEPDGRWFGRLPEVVFAADGPAAARLVPKMQEAIAGYAWRNRGDYRPWPGPNSNTFVAAVMDAVPEIGAALPPTAIGKDYPYDGRWLRPTPSGTGLRLTLGGYAGLTAGWVEGVELNVLGLVAGLDLRRPAVKLPGLGRLGLAGPDGPAAPLPAAERPT